MRVLFWGTPAFALPAFRALTEEGHDVVGVVTQPDRPTGRGRGVAMSPVKQAALEEGIPVLQPERARGEEFLAELRGLEPEVSVVVAFGQILRPEVLELPVYGSLNIHASLLPELRGAAPIQWAVMQGMEMSGITIMRMEAGLDSGPILFQLPEPIGADESASELALRLSEIGAEGIVEALALLQAGALQETPQDHSLATYAPKLDREMAKLDWTKPAAELAQRIRGLDAVPGAWTTMPDGAPLKLFRPRVEIHSGEPGEVLDADAQEGVLIGTGAHALRVREVQPPGKRRMSAAEWVRGRGIAAGARLGD